MTTQEGDSVGPAITACAFAALAGMLASFTVFTSAMAAQRSADRSEARAHVTRSAPAKPAAATLRAGYSARNVLDLPVRSLNLQHVGTISDIALDHRGRVLAIMVSTPERTIVRFPWDDSNIDLLQKRATVSTSFPGPATPQVPQHEPSIAAAELQVLVRPLLGGKAWFARDGYGTHIDDVIISRDGHAGALILAGRTDGTGALQLAQPFPSAFAYDAKDNELLIPIERVSRATPFLYAELGIVPPKARDARSPLLRALQLPRIDRTEDSAVIVPAALTGTEGDPCWARLYTDASFTGKPLTLVGPLSMAQLKADLGYDWDPRYESVIVGPAGTLTLYQQRGFRKKSATFKADQRVADLDLTMGVFRTLRSVKLDCAPVTAAID